MLVVGLGWWWNRQSDTDTLRVAIAPYQDIAMLVNYKHLSLDQKYGVSLQLMTMNWEDIPPAVASAGRAPFGDLLVTFDPLFGGRYKEPPPWSE